jgi:uncharacterized protein (TIGR03435 family)
MCGAAEKFSTYFAPVPELRTSSQFQWSLLMSAVWAAGSLFFLARWFRRWRLMRLTIRRSVRMTDRFALPAYSSASAMEPGVFGVFRPALLLPEGINDRLSPEQFEAVLIHELRHVRYRDNLTAALHMCVETLFWFHPLVWWIGARLTDERERDCDEAVLRQGSQPGAYARGIVQVCESYVGSPLACASGISGSDLRRRIREIMTWRGSLPVTWRAKAMLVVATLTAVAVPFAIGILRAQTLPAPPAYGYDAVSIHKSDPGQTNVRIGPGPQGGLRTVNTTAMQLLTFAYRVESYQIVGAPRWVSADHFDVTFTPDQADTTPVPGASLKDLGAFMNRNQQRMQAVLRDRFGLVLRAETHELPIYVLTQAKGGHKLLPHDSSKPGPSIGSNGRGQIAAVGVTVELLASQLSSQLQRPVRDESHLDGEYDFTLNWTPDPEPATPSANNELGPSIFSAISDQLGLRLESAKGPVQVYVVEKIDRPSEN